MNAIPQPRCRPEPWPGVTQPAVFLDVDGTLLEFADRPDAVVVKNGLIDRLEVLNERLAGAVALISGRPISDLDRIFDPLRLACSGLHGLEKRSSDGRMERLGDQHLLDRVREVMGRLAETDEGLLLEDKGPAVALHYVRARGKQEEVLRAARALRDELGAPLRLIEGHMVVEFTLGLSDKGKAVERFMGEAPFSGRRPIFVGDDTTDEDGFRAVNDLRGLSVRVGPSETSEACFELADVNSVHAFLGGLAQRSIAGVANGADGP